MQVHYHSMKALVFVWAATAILPAVAQEIETKSISIPAGKSSVSVKGSIKGYQTIDYILDASEGNELTVTMKTTLLSNYFNILAPGATDEAMFNSSFSATNSFKSILSQSGKYRIRVYMMRSDARRNKSASFTLQIMLKPAKDASADAKVEGTPFNATGQLQYAVGNAQMGSAMANFGVIRNGNGEATIHLQNPAGDEYIIRYAKEKFSCLSKDCHVKATKKGTDGWAVTINQKETFLLPEAVIFGG